jgi:hypothetical protein
VGSRALSLDNDVLTVAVKNETNKAFLVSRLNGQVSKTASDVIGREITVTYI